MRKLLLICLATAACADFGPTADGPVRLTRFADPETEFTSNSAFESAESGLVTNQRVWNVAYRRIFARFDPVPSAPTLRFADSSVVYVGIGYFGDWGHSVRLDSAAVRDQTLEVYYTETTREGCGGPAVAVSPVDAAQVQYWDGGVRFVQRDSLIVCS